MAATHDGVFTATIAAAVTSLTTTNSAALPAGDTILVALRASGTHGASDTVNGAYTQLDYDGSSLNHSDWIFQNSAGGASGAVTLTATGSTSGTIRVAGDYFGGVATSGQPFGHSDSAAGVGTSGTSYTAVAIAGDPGGSVVWASFVAAENTTATAGSSNGVSEVIGTQTATASGSISTEFALSTAAGSQASTISLSVAGTSGDQFFQVLLSPPTPPVLPIQSNVRATMKGRLR